MDLLRLILSHQPIDRLLRLPGLFEDNSFSRIRNQVLFLPEDCKIADWVRRGELSIIPPKPAEEDLVSARNVFLRISAYFLHNFDPTKVDFWYALASGIPEIQAAVLSTVKFELAEWNDLSQIPWTPALAELVLKAAAVTPVVRYHDRNDVYKIKVLTDYLKAKFFPDQINWRNPPTKGMILAITNDDTTVDEDRHLVIPEMTRNSVKLLRYNSLEIIAAKCGYIYPLLSVIRQAFGASDWMNDVFYTAVVTARKELLDAFDLSYTDQQKHLDFTFSGIAVTPKFLQRVQSILDDPESAKRLPTEVERSYRLLLGIDDGNIQYNTDTRAQVALPHDSVSLFIWEKSSIQGIVLYAPEVITASPVPDYVNLLQRKDYATGKASKDDTFTLTNDEILDNPASYRVYTSQKYIEILQKLTK